MQKPVLFIKNIEREGPGLFIDVLKDRGLGWKIVDLDQGDELPIPENYSAIVVLGGPDSANDTNDKMHWELMLAATALRKKIPYLGVCLGMQVLVKAGGGDVVLSPEKEVGFRHPQAGQYSISLTGKGRQDSLFEGLGSTFPVFQLHGETVELGRHMHLLGEGTQVRNQVVRVGENAYGLQCHFELTEDMLERWMSEDPELEHVDRTYLRNDYIRLREDYERTGKTIFSNFLNVVCGA